MGLALSSRRLVDLLENDAECAEQFKAEIVVLNEVLTGNGLPPHLEPETDGPAKPRAHCGGFSYSFLHYLRRASNCARERQPLTPVAPGTNPANEVEDDPSLMLDAHLLCHSDAEGFYVPIDFPHVIFDLDNRGLPGEMLGSTQRLMAELIEVAPAIGIALVEGRLSDADAPKLAAENDDETAPPDPTLKYPMVYYGKSTEHLGPYWRERLVWLALYENARVSIANKSLLVFC